MIKYSLRKKVLIIIIAFVVLLDSVIVFMSFHNFSQANEQFGYSTASTVAETCKLIIDGDKLEQYIETGRRDSAYYETWNTLINYRNTNENIIKLSVVWFDETDCHYIFDTDLTDNGAFLGDTVPYDVQQAAYVQQLSGGEFNEFIPYETSMDIYRPILSSYNIPMGYVQVGMSTAEAKHQQNIYLIQMITTAVLLTLLFLFIYMLVISHYVLQPINSLSEAAANYAKHLEDDGKTSALRRLSIRTGDEIEKLFISMKKMEADLLSSASNLSIAMWNSNHDSMTQLYNKRYLQEYIEDCPKNCPMAVFYFDVDNLKKMNDICGHESGDEVIARTAAFIKKYEGENGTGFRIGGDEFTLLIRDCTAEMAKEIFEKMQADPDKQLTCDNAQVSCRIAIGYAHGESAKNPESLIQEADKQMYLDKHSSRT